MDTKELTVTVRRPENPGQKRRKAWRVYSRMSLLLLASMLTARLVLLMIDVIQLHVAVAGAVSIPISAAVLVLTGWKLREWTEQGKEKNRCTTISAPSAGAPSTRAKDATARTRRTSPGRS